MKIDTRDLVIFDQVALGLRCALAERFTALSALTMSNGSGEVADQVDEGMRALNGPLAELQAWTDARDVCAEALDSHDEPTFQLIVAEMQEIYDELVEDGPSLVRAIPELFPHLIIQYGKLNRYLVAQQAAWDRIELSCEMIGPDALDNFKAGDLATINQALQIAARIGVADAIADGRLNSIETIREARSTLSNAGADPDAAGLPKIWPEDFVTKPAQPQPDALGAIIAQLSEGWNAPARDTASLNGAVGSDGLNESTGDAAGLDGGSDNIPTIFERSPNVYKSPYREKMSDVTVEARTRPLKRNGMMFMASRDLGHRGADVFERHV